MRWSATSAPVAMLLALGIGLGPQATGLLTAALPLLNPIIPVALAALGVLAGLRVVERRAAEKPMLAAAVFYPAIVIGLVALGMGTLIGSRMSAIVPSFWWLSIAAGICAATSLTLPGGNPFEPRSFAVRLSEAASWMPVLAGGVLLAASRAATPLAALTLLVQTAVVTLALAAAGWLLLRGTASATEERVFALATLLLVGGAADAMAASALLGGLMAGVVWGFAGGRSRDTMGRDVLFVQHPLLVLVLLVAGARAELSWPALVLGLAYAMFRLVAVVVGDLAAARFVTEHHPGDVARAWLRPGVFGVAFALNAVMVSGTAATLLLAAVVLGSIVCELFAFMLPARSDAE